MGKVVVDMSLSLDGFVAGPNDDVEQLHEGCSPAIPEWASDRLRSFLAASRSSCQA